MRDGGTSTIEGTRPPVLVHWPRDAERRAEAVRDGVPCLLVVGRPSDAPPVGPSEDWILEGASEQDVASRLATLAGRGRSAGPGHLPYLEVPTELHGDEVRLARILISRAGYLVPWRDLAADEVAPGAVERSVMALRTPLARSGWSLQRIGRSGVMVTEVAP